MKIEAKIMQPYVFDDAEHDKTGYNVHTSGEIALKCN